MSEKGREYYGVFSLRSTWTLFGHTQNDENDDDGFFEC